MILDKMKYHMVIGYDLGKKYAQISYSIMGGEPETVSTVAGTEQFTIPIVLCKRYEVNQWFYGKEAIRKAQAGEGVLVENLVELARKGTLVEVDKESFEPVALLALFFKRSLSLLSLTADYEKADMLVIAVKQLDGIMVDVLGACVNAMALKIKNIYFQSYVESIYHYIVHQPEELWSYQVLVCELGHEGLHTYLMGVNKKTVPMIAYMKDSSHEEFTSLPQKEWDAAFLKILQDIIGGHIISAAYLVGEGFKGEWNKEALRFLCRNRRVFQGNNLYSKGACYSAGDKQMEQGEKKLIFLGNDKLKSNVGMRVLRHGGESYCALLDAGVNWYEAQKKCDIILESGDSFSFLITSLTGGEKREVEMVLEGLEGRPDKTVRLSLDMKMVSEREMSVKIKDLGFGDIFPSSGMQWAQVFVLE